MSRRGKNRKAEESVSEPGKAESVRTEKPNESEYRLIGVRKAFFYSIIIAVLFFGMGFVVNPAVTGQMGVQPVDSGNDMLIFISPPGCTDCAELEPIAREVANTLGIAFVKTGFSQQMETPGFALVYEDKFLGATGFDSDYSLKGLVCQMSGNDEICQEAEELQPPEQPAPPAPEVPKSDRPELELFVMSFCPYGVQAETAIKPVVELLGDKADINVKFIVSIGGDTPESVQSLHGSPEAMEDLRQVCVRENYDYATFWNYVSEINENCYSIYRDEKAMETCWKEAAKTAGVDVSGVESCLATSSVGLIKQDEIDSMVYGAGGSPTFIINGVKVSPARTPEGIKQAICSAFNDPPPECQQVLEGGSEQQPTGGC